MGGVTRDSREQAIRSELEKQAPDLKLKYVTIYGDHVYASFIGPALPGGTMAMKGFCAPTDSPFEQNIPDPIIAAQLVGGARYWVAQEAARIDATNWAAP